MRGRRTVDKLRTKDRDAADALQAILDRLARLARPEATERDITGLAKALITRLADPRSRPLYARIGRDIVRGRLPPAIVQEVLCEVLAPRPQLVERPGAYFLSILRTRLEASLTAPSGAATDSADGHGRAARTQAPAILDDNQTWKKILDVLEMAAARGPNLDFAQARGLAHDIDRSVAIDPEGPSCVRMLDHLLVIEAVANGFPVDSLHGNIDAWCHQNHSLYQNCKHHHMHRFVWILVLGPIIATWRADHESRSRPAEVVRFREIVPWWLLPEPMLWNVTPASSEHTVHGDAPEMATLLAQLRATSGLWPTARQRWTGQPSGLGRNGNPDH